MTDQTIHVLMVEDNPGDTRLIRELVTQASPVRFTWDIADRLSAAKDILRVEPLDLVLLDLSLPDSHGLETFIHLQPHAICLPVVVLTGLDDELVAIEAVRAGAQDYLIKGQIEGDSLVRALRYAIERKRAETILRARNQQLNTLIEQLWPKARLATSGDELIASLTRELNDPLAKVSVQLGDLLEQFSPNDTRYAALQAIHAEVERMGRLVGNMLQASIETEGQAETDLQDLVQYLHEHQAISTADDETRFFEALGAWVAGYLLKDASVTPRSLNHTLKRMKKGSAAYDSLSSREREVVYLIAAGYTNKEIAKRLSLSVRTVERHSASVMNKLGLQNRAELIAYAVRHGIVNGNDVQPAKRRKNAN